jgi:tetratricopeptide (TPR) repeat protein
LARVESLPLSAAQNVASEVRAAVDAQPTITERTIKNLESKLSSMEGSYVSVGTAVRAALKESSIQQAQQGRDVVSKIDSLGGSIHKEVAVELRNAAADERAALGRLESRVGGLEGAVTGLEVAQGEGMRRLGSSLSSLLVDAEAGLQSAVREEAWKSLEPVRRLPQLLASLPALQQQQQQPKSQQLDMMLPHLSEESLRELMREQFNASTSQLLTAQEQLLFEIKSVASAAALRAEEIASKAAASASKEEDHNNNNGDEQQPVVVDISPGQWNQLGRRLLAMDEQLRELQQQQGEMLTANINASSLFSNNNNVSVREKEVDMLKEEQQQPPPPPQQQQQEGEQEDDDKVVKESSNSSSSNSGTSETAMLMERIDTDTITTTAAAAAVVVEVEIPISSWLSQDDDDAADTINRTEYTDVDGVGDDFKMATTTSTIEDAADIDSDVPSSSQSSVVVIATSSYSSDLEDATELIKNQQHQPQQEEEEEEEMEEQLMEEDREEEEEAAPVITKLTTTTTTTTPPTTATNSNSNTNEEIVAELCTKGLELLRGGRAQAVSAPNGTGDFGVADAAFWEAADCFERALDLDPTNVRALGNLGNVLMSHGRLKWKLLMDVEASSTSIKNDNDGGDDGGERGAVMAAIQASKNRLRAEAEELLLLAGRRYRAVLELDRAQPKALMNWGRVICLRGEMARCGNAGVGGEGEEEEEGLQIAASLFSNAADKFDAALELSDSGDIVPLKLEARALLDAGVCLGQLVSRRGGGRRGGDKEVGGIARQAKKMLRESERAFQEIMDVYPSGDEEVMEGIENCRGWLSYLSGGA